MFVDFCLFGFLSDAEVEEKRARWFFMTALQSLVKISYSRQKIQVRFLKHKEIPVEFHQPAQFGHIFNQEMQHIFSEDKNLNSCNCTSKDSPVLIKINVVFHLLPLCVRGQENQERNSSSALEFRTFSEDVKSGLAE